MSDQKVAPESPVQIESLSLMGVKFERADRLPDGATDVQGTFGLSAGEPENDRIRVDLEAKLEEKTGSYSVSVRYVVVLQKVGDFPEDREEEEYWETVGERIAPVVMYPYVRETMTSILSKAGLPPVMPAIIDFGRAKRVEPDTQEELGLDDVTEEV